MLINSGPWFDGSSWQLDVPSYWDSVIHVPSEIRFSNQTTNQLLLGFRRFACIGEGSRRDEWASKNLPPQEEWAYAATKSNLYFDRGGSPLPDCIPDPTIFRLQLGSLTGFAFKRHLQETGEMCGFFFSDNWNVYCRLSAIAADFPISSEQTESTMALLRFRDN